MNLPSETRYAIRLPDGRCLGRYTITGDIVPVPPVFAHIFDDLETAKAPLEYARTALGFPDAELAPLAQCIPPQPGSPPETKPEPKSKP
ncbi:MAG: hypothetical protein B9S35_15080 [Opitutia bacterium Tous-C5TDCM]|nr:MAG: hypothetical protein B9S35_15080 [Opitutae bacterium Tous-C5TDCM]